MTSAKIEAPAKLNRTDAASYLGISVPTLATWASHGKGPRFTKVGARVWYLVSELDRYIESRTTNCTSAIGD